MLPGFAALTEGLSSGESTAARRAFTKRTIHVPEIHTGTLSSLPRWTEDCKKDAAGCETREGITADNRLSK